MSIFVGLSSVLWKTADWMPFGLVVQLGPKMKQIDVGGDRPMGRGNFGGGYGASHGNQREFVA